MNKWEVQQAYWESFGLRAFNEQTVPATIPDDDGDMVPLVPPYITYEPAIGSINETVPISAKVWYYGTSNAEVTNKVTEMEPNVNRVLEYDGGVLKVRKAERWARQAPEDPTDEQIRAIELNVEMEFISK